MTDKRFHLRNVAKIALLAVVLSFSVGTITAQTYHPDDIKAINNIIANNGLAWTTAAPDDGTICPPNWTGVMWNNSTPKRITALHVSSKGLTGTLNVTALTSLFDFQCQKNNLTALSIANNVRYLICNYNHLTELDVSNRSQLYEVDCSNNNLTTLNVSNCINLCMLDCRNNNLTTLDVTGLPLTDWLMVLQNYMTSTSAVVGFTGTWDDGNFVFDPQNSPIPSFTTHPANSIVAEGGNTSFTVEASGMPAPTYMWYVLNEGELTWRVVSSFGSIYSGMNTATLTLTGVPADFNGRLYRCRATNSEGNVYSDAATLTVTGSVGIGNVKTDNPSLRVYPNPTGDLLHFSPATSFELIDLQGKVLLKSSEAVESVNVSSLASGVYLVRLITDKGNVVRKVVKE